MPINEKLILEIRADVAQLKKGIAQSRQSVNKFQSSLKGVASTLKVAVTAALGLAARQAVIMAKSFDKSLTQITALVGVAKEDVKKMGEAARKMAVQTGRSATDAADALFYITSAGLRGAEAMEVLEASLKASAVGLGETKTIADLATSALNAYGIENLSATDATDVLTASVREGKLEASELASSMGMVLPVASNMGVKFHEVGAAFAAMSRTGTNASMAATSLQAILSGLLKPTAEAEKALDDMGLSSKGLKQQIEEEGLLSVLKTLKTEFDNNKDAAAQVFPNLRALRGVLDLVGASAETNAEIFVSLSKSVNATDEAFDDSKTHALEFDIEIAKINNNLLSIGQRLLPMVNKGLRAFNFIIGGKEANDFRTELEKQKDHLVKVEKAVKTATDAYEYWLDKGKTPKQLEEIRTKMLRQIANLKTVQERIAELTKEEEKNTTAVDKNTEAKDENNNSIITTISLFDEYKNKLRELINQNEILGHSFDFTSAKIDLMQKSLTDMLNAGEGGTTAFKNLKRELLSLQNVVAMGEGVKMGIEADLEGDADLDEWFPDDETKKILDNYTGFTENLKNINAQMSQDISDETDKMFADDMAKKQEAFGLYATTLTAIGQMFSEQLGEMTDSLVDNMGLADTGMQGLIKSMLKMLARLATQRLISSMINKMLAKVDIGVKQGQANAGAITAATNMAAGMGPYGLLALPGLIAGATTLVNASFAGVHAFAEGGIVTKPMMGLVGEAGNEAIIPLDRLNNMVGPTTGEFTLRGQDLVLALNRADNFKDRILN
jgi:TP901 family phage tail tape measure protein